MTTVSEIGPTRPLLPAPGGVAVGPRDPRAEATTLPCLRSRRERAGH